MSTNVNFVKTTLHFGSIKSTGCHYFQMFFEKIKGLMPIFCQKIIYALKTHFSYVSYFVKKTSILTKTHCSHIIFSNFEWKNSCFHTHIKSNNFNSVKTTLYYRPKKSIGCPLFLIFEGKITALMPYFETFILNKLL